MQTCEAEACRADVFRLSWEEQKRLAAALHSCSWAPAGVVSGELYVCSAWLQEPGCFGDEFCIRQRSADRSSAAWLQHQRCSWVSALSLAEQLQVDRERGEQQPQPQQQCPAGFALTSAANDVARSRQIPAMHEPRHGAALQLAHGKLFACGGWADDWPEGSSSATEVYDPVTDSWKPVPPQPPRVECRFWAEGNNLAGQVCTSAQAARLLPLLPASSAQPEDEEAREPLLTLGYSREAEGMRHGCQASATVECFDPNTGCWQHLPPLIDARADASAASVAGVLYVFGGFGSDGLPLRSVERWDPVACTWVLAPPMSKCRALAATRIVDGGLLVCGGIGSDRRALSSAERFDPRAYAWKPHGSRQEYASSLT